MTAPITYKDSGVDIDAGDNLVDTIAPFVKKTHRPEVMSHLGGYAGLFSVDLKKYKEPVMVSSTDGVGTKLKLAFEMKKFDTLGDDLVAMCVNDLICCGAEPVFFLDYFATGKLEGAVGETVIKSIAEALAKINCSLIGGETAEMPGLYSKGEFDLAGFSVGLVEKSKIIDGHSIQIGNKVIGVASSGVHSNGYSLVRKILEANNLALNFMPPGFSKNLGETLLTPTKIYVNPVLNLLKQNLLLGIAHITGGGIIENVPRVLPDGYSAKIDRKLIATPAIFKFLQEKGSVPENEMWRVFNMGIGLVLIVDQNNSEKILQELNQSDFSANIIGEVVKRGGDNGVQLI